MDGIVRMLLPVLALGMGRGIFMGYLYNREGLQNDPTKIADMELGIR